jgi:hypothetical protein
MLAIYLVETEVLFKVGDFIPNSIRSYGKCMNCTDLKFSVMEKNNIAISYVTTDSRGTIIYNGTYVIENII